MLKVNYIASSDQVNDIIAVLKDDTSYEDFCLHLKMFEIDKLKESTINVDIVLTKLNFKCASLLKQNK